MNRRVNIWAYLLVVYWVLLLVATHIPRVAPPPGVQLPRDDVLHFAAYFVLALLALSAWSRRKVLGPGDLAIVAVVLIGYGAFDEWSQTPVGRDASVSDWLADAAGVLVGVLVFGACTALLRRRTSAEHHVR